MKRLAPSTLWIATVSLAALAGWGAFAAGTPAQEHAGAHPSGHVQAQVQGQGQEQICTSAPSSAYGSFQKQMDAGMGQMMQKMHGDGYSGNVDVDFLAMMIPHHAGAVDMARLVLQHGTDPVTRQLAQEIIAGQTVEIESMQRRLDLIKREGGAGEEFPALSGTRGP